ncbi:MAG: DUF3261 domain-containing protein [bacterium]|nr:DUF3261 domain-containing protein [bacterium]
MRRIGKRFKFHLVLSLVLLTNLAACSTTRLKEMKAPRVKERSHSLAHGSYPEEFTLSQHILLTLRDKEYDFMAYLVVDRSRGFRALAFTDMGGKVFDFFSLNSESKIVSKPGIMPEAPILKGVMEEIALIFMTETGDDEVIHQEGTGLKSGKAELETTFSSDKNLLSYELKKEGSLISKVSLSKYRMFPGWTRLLPSEINIRNYRWNYTVNVTLLKINPGPINKNALTP